MSFVGTRPEVTKYVKKYTKEMRATQYKGVDLSLRSYIYKK